MYGVFNQQHEFCHIWSLKISHVCRGDPHGCEGTRNRSALFHSHVLSFMACFDYEKSIGLLLQHTQKQIHWQTHTRWPPPPSPLTLGSQWQQVKTGPTWTGHFWFTGEASLFLRFFPFLYSRVPRLCGCDSKWEQVSMCRVTSAGQMGFSGDDIRWMTHLMQP